MKEEVQEQVIQDELVEIEIEDIRNYLITQGVEPRDSELLTEEDFLKQEDFKLKELKLLSQKDYGLENLTSYSARWDNWGHKAVQITKEKLVMHSNGDTEHSGRLYNRSRIHKKTIRIFIKAYRRSTDAHVFSTGYFSTTRGKRSGTSIRFNKYDRNVKEHWKDISRGNMKFSAVIVVEDHDN